MNYSRPILVTGSPRSGTSWIGRMIAQAPFVRYVHEPLNISGNSCRCGQNFDYWFYYLTSEDKFNRHLKHVIYPAYNLIGFLNILSDLRANKRVHPLGRYLQAYLFQKPLLKDPIAVFSAEQLADLFNMDIVISIRHPAAFVNSYKKLNWTHPFSHFLQQPALMEDHLVPYQSQIEDFVKNDYDIVDQAALLWKLIYSVIDKYRKKHPEWTFVRHEELALNPIEGFHRIFERLSLPYSQRTRLVIENHNLQHEKLKSYDPYSIQQNPEHVVSKWKRQLTAEEIYRIRKRVDDISTAFYADEYWHPY